MTNELNKEGLEAARLEVVGVIQDCGTLGRVGDIIPSEEITKAALKAYLPYHNAELEAENKRLRQWVEIELEWLEALKEKLPRIGYSTAVQTGKLCLQPYKIKHPQPEGDKR